MNSSALSGIDWLHTAMAARVDNGGLPGIVTLVAKGDGRRRLCRHDPHNGFRRQTGIRQRATIFRITSMTKPILGAATMLYAPSPKKRSMRKRQLAMAQPDPRTPHEPDEWIVRFATLTLMYQPVEQWRGRSHQVGRQRA